jgi:hypothetical protein
METPQGKAWKIAENRTLKWGSSPPRAEEEMLFRESERSTASGKVIMPAQSERAWPVCVAQSAQANQPMPDSPFGFRE